MFGAAVPAQALAVITLSHAEALRYGKKIWQTNANGTVAGLTSWNEGEDFASLASVISFGTGRANAAH